MQTDFDLIVAGSGIAGLSFALTGAQNGLKVALITKKSRADSNTNHAQGGIAAVTSDADDFESHVRDTLIAGDGLCNEQAVRTIIAGGPQCIRQLVERGVNFTQQDGSPALGKEGGHSQRRILHVKDMTGRAIEAALLKQAADSPNITLLEHFLAIDIVTSAKLGLDGENRVIGLYALDVRQKKVRALKAKAVTLSTGGVGQVYQYTTNPAIATGDGVAMAYRAGVPVANMEFIQFHPTAFYTPQGERFLISEAVRGEGGVLRNTQGEAFMQRYDPRADLAPRDIVARAIDQEMKRSGARHVWLDVTAHDQAFLKDRFPTIFEACEKNGIDISKDWIPVVPAAHYECGGVVTNLDAQTQLKGLFACGEIACTGLHGANRLASNSLLEAVVLAQRGAAKLLEYLEDFNPPNVELPQWVDGDLQASDERVVLSHNLDELKRAMWDYVGIMRSEKRLKRALTRIGMLQREIDEYYWNFKVDSTLIELRNLVLVADIIVRSALMRKESRGLHYTLDFPEKLPQAHDSIVQKQIECAS